MTDDRFSGTASFGGREGIGKVTGDTKTEVQGVVNQAAGAVQEAYGKTVETAAAGHDYLKTFIEENPYTTVAVAMGIGLLLGYTTHRPPPRRYWWN